MSRKRLEYLFNLHVQQACTSQEEEELMVLLQQPENELLIRELIDKQIAGIEPALLLDEDRGNRMMAHILLAGKEETVPSGGKRVFFMAWKKLAVAAVFLLFAGVTYLLLDKKQVAGPALLAEKNAEILPGGNRAILSLADGRKIVLDSMQNGTLLHEGTTLIKKQGSVLVYQVSEQPLTDNNMVYNTLTTPKGGQYEVVLPDGTKVWLNAASSISFPTVFAGSQREVHLTGEAYFEVTKNKKQPFRVKVNDAAVEVLGTHFNINSYKEEKLVRTSLLEGSVRVTKNGMVALLKPGEQGIIDNQTNQLKVAVVDMNEVMAWKNGLFQFEGADIMTIMRQIGRWYDMDIVFSGKMSMRRFQGKISRNVQLAEVLKILELSNVQFSVQGKKILVR